MLLYSIVYRFRDFEYHEDTLSVGPHTDTLITFAREWAKKVDYYPNDNQSMWLYVWKKGNVPIKKKYW